MMLSTPERKVTHPLHSSGSMKPRHDICVIDADTYSLFLCFDLTASVVVLLSPIPQKYLADILSASVSTVFVHSDIFGCVSHALSSTGLYWYYI